MYALLKPIEINGVLLKEVVSIVEEKPEIISDNPAEKPEDPYVLCSTTTSIGDIYVGGGFTTRAAIETVPFARSVAEAKNDAYARLAEQRWLAEQRFSFNGVNITLDDNTQRRIAGAIQYLELSGADNVRWRVSPGTVILFDLQALTALGIAVGVHIQACFARVEEYDKLIATSDTVESIDALTFYAGWP